MIHASRSARGVLLEHLETRLLASASAVGYVDAISRADIHGWAFSPAAGSGAIWVEIQIDQTAQMVLANQNRPDLTAYGPVGSPNHGFSFTPPAGLENTTHTVKISMLDPSTGTISLLGQGTLKPSAPFGAVDLISDSLIAGWAFDPSFGASAIQIRIDLDGNSGAAQIASQPRLDLTAYAPVGSPGHGFAISGDFAGHLVGIWALNPTTGQATLLKTNDHAPIGFVDFQDSQTIRGWTADPDATSASIPVSLRVDGQLTQRVVASVSRPDLIAYAPVGSPNHGFSLDLSGLSDGVHHLVVSAEDPVYHQDTVLFDKTVTLTSLPFGYIDSATLGGISGWALDTRLGNAPVEMDLYLDGTYQSTQLADEYRPDLIAPFGSPDHGFQITPLVVPLGTHRIDVYMAVPGDSQSTLLGSATLTNQSPTGSLEAVSSAGLSGWAYDPDQASGQLTEAPLQVELTVDQVPVEFTDVTLARPDLSVFSGPVGYFLAMPLLSPGSHTLSVYAIDQPGGLRVLLGSVLVS